MSCLSWIHKKQVIILMNKWIFRNVWQTQAIHKCIDNLIIMNRNEYAATQYEALVAYWHYCRKVYIFCIFHIPSLRFFMGVRINEINIFLLFDEFSCNRPNNQELDCLEKLRIIIRTDWCEHWAGCVCSPQNSWISLSHLDSIQVIVGTIWKLKNNWWQRK